MKTKITTLALFCSLLFSAKGQDIFFSQFYAAPLILNPAFTGFYNGDMRLTTNYRNSSQGLIPYVTTAAAADFKLLRASLKPNNLATGIIVSQDNIGNGQITNLNATSSTAFHWAVDNVGNHILTFGAQLGLFQRHTNPNSFTFGNQWSAIDGFSESNSSKESYTDSESSWVFDLNFGMMWYSKINDEAAVYAGGSVFHLLEPNESFYGLEEKLARRYCFHGGVRFAISSEVTMIPNVIFMSQNKAQQIAEGSSFEYKIGGTGHTFKVGAWYRHSDGAVIFSTGLQFRELQVGVSSDFMSSVQLESQTKGALELSIIYAPFFKRPAKLKADPTRRF